MLAIIMAIENESDRGFVARLYCQYEKKLKKMAFGIVKNEFDAEECVHETVLSVIEHLNQYKNANESGIEKLLVISCKNIALAMYRNKKRDNANVMSTTQKKCDSDLYCEMEIEDPNEDVERLAVNEYTLNLIFTLLNELEPMNRDIFILKYQYGMSSKEIAKIMKISDEAVRMRIFRTKKQLLANGGDELYDLAKR